MPTICRLIQLTPEIGAALKADPNGLDASLSVRSYRSDVYRYWDAIRHLLSQHSPDSIGARWLHLGDTVGEAIGGLPAARLIRPEQVAALGEALQRIEPDALAPHYDAAVLDEAGVYPGTYAEWEEDFDPLGQILEHYSFLQEFIARTAADGAWMVLKFEELDEGSV